MVERLVISAYCKPKFIFIVCILVLKLVFNPPLQNIAVTYLGMYIGGDYVFEMFNFIGINVR